MELIRDVFGPHPLVQVVVLASILGPLVVVMIVAAGGHKRDQRGKRKARDMSDMGDTRDAR